MKIVKRSQFYMPPEQTAKQQTVFHSTSGFPTPKKESPSDAHLELYACRAHMLANNFSEKNAPPYNSLTYS